MKQSATDHAIQKLQDKIAVLNNCIAELEAVRPTAAEVMEPKVRKTRKKRGMPAAEGL